MAFTDFTETDWTTGDTITAALLDELEKRAAGARPYLQAKKTADLSIADTTTVVTFDTETYDNDDMFNGTNIEIQLTGVYHILFTAAWSGTAGLNDYTELDIINWQDPTAYPLAKHTAYNVQYASAIWWQQVSYVERLASSTILQCRATASGFTGILEHNAGGTTGDSIHVTATMLARDPGAS